MNKQPNEHEWHTMRGVSERSNEQEGASEQASERESVSEFKLPIPYYSEANGITCPPIWIQILKSICADMSCLSIVGVNEAMQWKK